MWIVGHNANEWCGWRSSLAAAKCQLALQHIHRIFSVSTVEVIGFWHLTCYLPSLTHSLVLRLLYCQPTTPTPPPYLDLQPAQSIWGNKVGPTPIRPFLSPTTSLTLHTAAPLFSVQAELGRLWQAMPAKALNNRQWKINMQKQCQLFPDLKNQPRVFLSFFSIFFSPSICQCFSLHLIAPHSSLKPTPLCSLCVPAASSSSPQLAPDLEQARPTTSGEEELQLQLALAMSREESEKVPLSQTAHTLPLSTNLSSSRTHAPDRKRLLSCIAADILYGSE